MKKILYFDVETTGLNCILQDVIQLAFVITIDGEVVEEHDIKMQPFSYENISQEALDVHGITLEEIKTFQSPYAAYEKIVNIFSKHINKFDKHDKFVPAGYNVRFDLDFMAQFFEKNKDKYFGSWQNWRALDPLPILYAMDAKGLICLPDYKLETVAEYYKIPIKAHDALSDIHATRKLLYKLVKYIGGKENDGFKKEVHNCYKSMSGDKQRELAYKFPKMWKVIN